MTVQAPQNMCLAPRFVCPTNLHSLYILHLDLCATNNTLKIVQTKKYGTTIHTVWRNREKCFLGSVHLLRIRAHSLRNLLPLSENQTCQMLNLEKFSPCLAHYPRLYPITRKLLFTFPNP